MNARSVAGACCLFVAAACAAVPDDPKSANAAMCEPAIMAFGTRDAVAANPAHEAVRLADVALGPNSIGYGPGAGYQEELSIIDGQWQIARATSPDTVEIRTAPGALKGAAFLVSATPARWQTRRLETTIEGMAGLESLLAGAGRKPGCPETALPFRITGILRGGEWSVVGRPSGAQGRLDEAGVTLVGVHDSVGSDRYFMPAGRTVHVHLLTDDGRVSGHLNSFDSLESIILSIPE